MYIREHPEDVSLVPYYSPRCIFLLITTISANVIAKTTNVIPKIIIIVTLSLL